MNLMDFGVDADCPQGMDSDCTLPHWKALSQRDGHEGQIALERGLRRLFLECSTGKTSVARKAVDAAASGRCSTSVQHAGDLSIVDMRIEERRKHGDEREDRKCEAGPVGIVGQRADPNAKVERDEDAALLVLTEVVG